MIEITSILVAAIAAYAFGSIWYMALSRPWMRLAGLSGQEINRKRPTPYIIAFACTLVVAFMMQFLFAQLVILSPVDGLIIGLSVGLFIVVPWIATNYTFAMRPRLLIAIDGGYAAIGCGIIGLVLNILPG